MIRKGEPWGGAASRPPDVEVEGDDAALARCVAAEDPGRLIRYRPSAAGDLARAVGLTVDTPGITELAVDALEVRADGAAARPAVNAAVLGTAPDQVSRWTRRRPFEVAVNGRAVWAGKATGIVVANGQFLHGLDLIPRGHPGDGRAEIQIHALGPGERAGMRRRLATGTHLPHPRIVEHAGRVVDIVTPSQIPLEVDGVDWAPARMLRVSVVPGALRILV